MSAPHGYQDAINTLQTSLVVIPGSFAPNGNGAVAAASNTGRGFSVARTDVGKFTITLTERYDSLVSFGAMVSHETPDCYTLCVEEVAVAAGSANTIKIQLFSGVADPILTDAGPHANTRIYFTIWLKNSTVSP